MNRHLTRTALSSVLSICLSSSWALAQAPAHTESLETETAETESVEKESVESESVEKGGDSGSAADTTEESEAETPIAPPQVDPYEEAKERVARAEQLYEDGNYDAALTEFQRAYETMLGHPARSYVLFNIGRCQEKLYRYDAAIRSYRQYLEEAGPEAEDRGTVTAKIELLEGLLGSVQVVVGAKKGEPPRSYQLWVDGRLIGENATRFSIPGGNHEVEIRADGFQPELKEVQVAARQDKDVSFSLSPLAKEYKGIAPTYFYVTGGLALAAGAVGGVYGVLTLNKRSEINNKEGALVTPKDEDQLKNRALMADIFLISAGVLATSATVLAFMTDWSPRSQEEAPENVRVKEVGFAPLPHGGFVNVMGTF